MNAHAGRTRLGCVVLLVAIAAMILFRNGMELFWTRVDQRRFPWAYTDSGRPALVGTWVGSLTTATGAKRGMLLDLRLAPLRFGSGRRRGGNRGAYRKATSDKLVGELRLCGGTAPQRFTLHGNNLDDDASRFRLSFAVADSTPPDGLAPSHLRGTWNHEDSLRIEADLYQRRGVSAITDGADPETGRPQLGALHRGGEADFRTACNRMNDGR